MIFRRVAIGDAFKEDGTTYVKVKEVSTLHGDGSIGKKNALIVRGATTAGCGPEIYRPGDLIYFREDVEVHPLTLSFL